MKSVKEIFRKESVSAQAPFLFLALLPAAAIAVYFLRKILAMKQFVFGDDVQFLKWFRTGRIAFPLREIVSSRLEDGRFFPLCYENLNVLSLLKPDLTLANLAEHCFYVQAGMWLLCCITFFSLMVVIAKNQKEQMRPVFWLFVPLALLTMLCTPAFVSYFLMLIFPETRLCVLFLLFFIFYLLAYRKDHALCYVAAWFWATISIFCKENVFSFFFVLCGVWGLCGWKLLNRKHKIFLAGLLASIVCFLALYYFIVYHNTVEAYNASRPWGRTFLWNVGTIFRDYPIWIFAFLLGSFRLIRVVLYREKKHLFVDAMLFAALGFFFSYLALKLTDWWYWGIGATVILPVSFYWFLSCKKTWCKAVIFLALLLSFAVSVKPTHERLKLSLRAQREDPVFLQKVDSAKGGKRILFPMLGHGNESVIEDACYKYLKEFLEKLGTPGKWQGNVTTVTELPKWLAPGDVCVVWRGVPLPPELRARLQMNGFQRIADCYFYEAYAGNSADLDAAWKSAPPPDGVLSVKEPFFRFGSCFSSPEPWGRWTDGSDGELGVFIPPDLRGEKVKMTWDVYTFVHEKNPLCRYRILTDGKLLQEGSSRQFSTSIVLDLPAECTGKTWLPLTIHVEDPHSPQEFGVSADPRKLGVGLKTVRMTALP